MRKVIAVILTFILVLSLAACGSSDSSTDTASEAAETSDDEDGGSDAADDAVEEIVEDVSDAVEDATIDLTGKKVGFSDINMSDQFFADMDEQFEELFTEYGMEYTGLSAENNANTQIENIENFIAMGMDYILLYVLDANSISDTLVKAREAGAYVIVIGNILEDSEAYDLCVYIDQETVGNAAAQLAAEWVEETFPDAEDGEIEVAVYGSVDTDQVIIRSDSLKNIVNYTSKVTIVAEYVLGSGEDGNTKSQEWTDMLFMQYPDVDLILTYGSNVAQGSNEVAANQDGVDKDKFAIFTVDTSDIILEAIAESGTNDSLIRGTVTLGVGTPYTCYMLMSGQWMDQVDENGIFYEVSNPVTIDNVAEYMD